MELKGMFWGKTSEQRERRVPEGGWIEGGARVKESVSGGKCGELQAPKKGKKSQVIVGKEGKARQQRRGGRKGASRCKNRKKGFLGSKNSHKNKGIDSSEDIAEPRLARRQIEKVGEVVQDRQAGPGLRTPLVQKKRR